MMDRRLLRGLYMTHSPSGREAPMRAFITAWLDRHVGRVDVMEDAVGNLLVTRGVSDCFPCVVAHMDQVQDVRADDFRVIEGGGVMLGFSDSERDFQGLGADDKNGIYVALRCLQRFPVMKAAFFVSEEVGCVGSSEVDMAFFADTAYVIQCDRRNGWDAVTSIGGTELCGEDFTAAMRISDYGYEETAGALSDVMMLKERGLAVACVNLSCGYYNPHTEQEFTVLRELENCEAMVTAFITNDQRRFVHVMEDLSWRDDTDSLDDVNWDSYGAWREALAKRRGKGRHTRPLWWYGYGSGKYEEDITLT